MTTINRQTAADAWNLKSWLLSAQEQRQGPTRANLARLADALEAWPGGLAGRALAWPAALRKIAAE